MAEELTIEELRKRIDAIDEQLVRLLNVRVACAVEVGRLKHEAGLPVYQPARAQVLGGVLAATAWPSADSEAVVGSSNAHRRGQARERSSKPRWPGQRYPPGGGIPGTEGSEDVCRG